MPAARRDPISQRVLVPTLKRAIDLYLYQDRDHGAAARIREIVARNPHSALSTHVLHNLGAERRAVLLPLLHEPNSFAIEIDEVRWDG